MMKKQLFLILALLCAVVQGAWAQNYDVWDGVTYTQPKCTMYDYTEHVTINSAAEMAWVMKNFSPGNGYSYVSPYSHNTCWDPVDYVHEYILNVDVDMTVGTWIPIGSQMGDGRKFHRKFHGNGHTIKFKINGATENYQGMFDKLIPGAEIKNLHVDCDIHCTDSRLVGGICGENTGVIENCWVSGSVRSDWREPSSAYTAKVGGICGENNLALQYCCVTADVTNDDADVGGIAGDNSGKTISHCTFYGTVHSTHSQDSKYVGDSGTENYCYDTFTQSEYNDAQSYGAPLYSKTIKYPYTVTVKTEGRGAVQVSAGGETNIPGWRNGETVTLTKTSGTVHSVIITDADGNNVSVSGNETSGYTFTMPKKNVTATVVFDFTDWPRQGEGTVDAPYIISSTDDWYDFAHNVNLGRNYSGKYVKLTNNISVTTMAGGYVSDESYKPFSGTFDGDGHTLTINVSNQSRFAAPFKCVKDATIKNLRTAGTISGIGNKDGKLLAGLVGVSFGNTTISGCRSSMTLTTDFGARGYVDATLTGIVAGTKGGNLTIEGCVFDGSMTDSRNTRCAGIAGYEYGGTTTTISNCLFLPKTLTVSTTDDGYTKTFTRDPDATITNCYYSKVLGTAQGALCISTAEAPSKLGTLVKDYGMVKAYEHGLQFDGKYYFAASISEGTGTEGDPYIISNDNEWLSFSTFINDGTDYSGKFVQLVANINITTPVGSYSNNKPFCGTFLGNGHTITVSLTNDGNQGLAPFRYINGATIKELTVRGTIASNARHTGGLVGFASGTNLIENCFVYATLNISNDYAGGILGHGLTSNTTIRDCLFAGAINGLKNGPSYYKNNVGGIWGWSDSGCTAHLESCLEKGSYQYIESMHPIGMHSGTGNFFCDICYYVNPPKGTPIEGGNTIGGAVQVSTTAPDNDVYEQLLLVDYYYYYIAYTLGGVAGSYDLRTNPTVSITPTLTNRNGTGLVLGTDFTAKLNDADVTAFPVNITKKGKYTLTFTGTGSCTGSKSVSFIVIDNLEGDGSETTPYTINNDDDWEIFAYFVNNGNNYSDKFVRLDADVNVSTPVGLSDNRPFSGTFLGNGKTITATISSTTSGTSGNEQGVAPFHYIKDAAIKNLKVAGNIASASYHTGGLVGFADGTNTIEGCVVTATLDIRSDYAGGIIGHGLTSATTIKGCVFAGTINGVSDSRSNIGGIWGWSDSGTPTLENCLEKGTYNNIASMHPMGLQKAAGTITNCYYVNAQMGSPSNACTVSGAKQAYALTTATGYLGEQVGAYGTLTAYQNGILCNNTYYLAPILSGSGTENAPYTINSTEEWNAFANYVNSGISFSGEHVKLASDISVSTMAGTSDAYSFQGTFDGNGKTLTFNNGTAESPFNEPYCAPFRHVKNAVIKNLHVAGTIYTSAQNAAGFVGESHGALTITGCRSSVNINSSRSGDGTHGGFVSTLSGAKNAITIDGCVFDGSFATTASTTNCGGFIGWPVWNRPTIKNSLMKPSRVDASMLNNTFARWHTTNNIPYEPTIDNCYYVAVDNLPTNQGKQAYALATAPANLGSSVQNYGMLTAYENGILFDGTYYVAPATISLANAADNSTTISDANGYFADVTLSGRTLYKDGDWNTLCLPFNLTIAGSPLDGADARQLTSASISGTTLNLTFGDAVTTLTAGTPYIIRWEKADDYLDDDAHNLVNPVFKGVTIDKTDRSYDNGASGDERVRFLGTYKSTTFDAVDKSILFMGGKNTLYYPENGASIGAQRAYFKIGEDGASQVKQLTAFNLNFGDERPTLISLPSAMEEAGAWYDLNGRRLNAKPVQKGVYINNGRKVVIK